MVSERFFGRLFVVTSVNAREKNGDLVDDRNALLRNGDVLSERQGVLATQWFGRHPPMRCRETVMCSANAIAHWQHSGLADNRPCTAEKR